MTTHLPMRDLRAGDTVMLPSGRLARVLKLIDDGDYAACRYADTECVNRQEEREAEVTLAVGYCRLVDAAQHSPGSPTSDASARPRV